MVLSMADFGKSWKSLQTLWNGSKALLNGFLTALATLCVDLGWIRKSRNLADFEQKPWTIAHGFEHGRFWQVLEIAPNSLKSFGDLLCRTVNLADFDQKPWAKASPGNRSKLSETVINWFLTGFCVYLRWIRTHFEQKPWAIAHGFEHGRFWQVLEIAPNSLKRFQSPLTALATLCVDLEWIRKSRNLAKNPGLFWTWPILASPGNRSKLKRFQSPHKRIFNCFGDSLCLF